MKKTFARVLAVLLLFALAACGGTPASSGGVSSSATGGDSSLPEQKEVVYMTAWHPNQLITGTVTVDQKDTVYGPIVAAETGISFTSNYMSAADPGEAFNLKLATDDWEDVLNLPFNTDWTTRVEKLIQNNTLVPLDDYFTQPDVYPNLAAIPEEVLNNYRSSDGHIYYFPSGWYQDVDSIYGYWCASGWYVLPEYLDAVGMTQADLATIEGVEAFLVAVKEKDLKTAEGLPVLPMSGGENAKFVETVLNTFGVSTANFGFDIIDGTPVNFRDNPKTKEAIQWLNKLYNEGLIDKEVATQKNDQFTEKLMNSRVALVSDSAFDFWGAVTAGESPVTEMAYLNFPKVSGVDALGVNLTYNPYGNAGVVVTKNCPDVGAVARLADWGSEKGMERSLEVMFGPRGVAWEFDEVKGDPWYNLIDPELDTAMSAGDYATVEKINGGVVGVSVFVMDINYINESVQDTLAWIFNMHKFNAEQGYHTAVRPMDTIIMPADGAWNTNIATLKNVDIEYQIKLISAPAGEFEATWTQYQQQLESQGNWSSARDEYIAEYGKLA